MHYVHTVTFESPNHKSVDLATRLLPKPPNEGWLSFVKHVAKARDLPNVASPSSCLVKVCWRSSAYAVAMRLVPVLELEILDEINIIAEARGLSIHQAFLVVAEEYDRQDDIRAAILQPAYVLCQYGGLTLAAALKREPVFSASVCRVLILTEGGAAQSLAGGKLAADRMARKCNWLGAVLGGLAKAFMGMVGHSR